MKVSLVIPAYNVGHTIGRTLEACLRQDVGPHEVEIVVVDDGSTDDTAEQVQRYPVKYVRQQNAGAAIARNTGVSAATGEIIAFIDSDCEPIGDTLLCITEALERERDGCIVGGIYAPAQDSPLIEAAINEEIRYRHVRAPEEVQHIGSFCMAMRQEHLREIGAFNRRYERSEDLDLSYRAADKGYRLRTLQGACFIHRHPRTVTSWLKDQYHKARGRVENTLRFSKMLKSDGYTDHRDWASLLLAMLAAMAIPLIWLPRVRWIALGSLGLSALLQVPLAAFAVRDTGDWRQVVLIPLQLLRGFAWAAGAVVGLGTGGKDLLRERLAAQRKPEDADAAADTL
jgi:glycosyltransferase involved in cell wall biosynthesis